MRQYLDLLSKIKEDGSIQMDRTGTGTKSIFGYQMRFDLQKGFPIVTTKKIYINSIIYELLWFLKGYTNIKYLKDNKVGIWDDDAYRFYLKNCGLCKEKPLSYEEFLNVIKNNDCQWSFGNGYILGDLGPVYGKQWTNWDGINQIERVIESIKTNPSSRRHIVSAWNVGEVDDMALPPCHTLFQFYVSNGKLSCQLYQRSGDAFLGIPFNISSYSLLTMMIAQVTGLEVGEFIHTIGDAHIYLNHLEQVDLQLTREPNILPEMCLNKEIKNINDFKFEDFILLGYEPHSSIKGKLSTGLIK